MKHLKKFNESLDYESKIKEFCENYLAYLLDENEFVFKLNQHGKHLEFKLDKSNGYLQNGFKWSEVKDYFIPFLQIFIDTFYISGDFVRFSVSKPLHTDYDIKLTDVLNDNIYHNMDDFIIRQIVFYTEE